MGSAASGGSSKSGVRWDTVACGALHGPQAAAHAACGARADLHAARRRPAACTTPMRGAAALTRPLRPHHAAVSPRTEAAHCMLAALADLPSPARPARPHRPWGPVDNPAAWEVTSRAASWVTRSRRWTGHRHCGMRCEHACHAAQHRALRAPHNTDARLVTRACAVRPQAGHARRGRAGHAAAVARSPRRCPDASHRRIAQSQPCLPRPTPPPQHQVFGLLAALQRERWDFNRRWVAARLALEHLQLVALVLQPRWLWALPYGG